MNKTTQSFYLSSISNAMKGKAAMKKQTSMSGMKKKDVIGFVYNVKTAGGTIIMYICRHHDLATIIILIIFLVLLIIRHHH